MSEIPPSIFRLAGLLKSFMGHNFNFGLLLRTVTYSFHDNETAVFGAVLLNTKTKLVNSDLK